MKKAPLKKVSPKTLNIGQAAAASGVSAKMIRHYESIGLIPEARRTASGYRLYDEADVHTLRFVRRARELGFSMPEISKLIGLWKNRSRASAEVKRLAQQHVRDLNDRITKLQEMRDTLQKLVACCKGDQRPDCPILSAIARRDSFISTSG